MIVRHRTISRPLSHPILRRRSGLGMVEALISLSIVSMLLVAIAAAFDASSALVQNNDEFFRASQAARVSINQVMAEVRKCSAGVVDVSSLEVTPPSGDRRVYSFDATNRQITLLILPANETSRLYTLARNVDSATFNTDGNSVSVTVTVKAGRNQVTLNGSAVPRRTLQYR